MPNQKDTDQLVLDALSILESCGIPVVELSVRRREKMAKAFLAVADVRPGVTWSRAKGNANDHRLTTRKIIHYMNSYLSENIADSSYDDIRRKDLILPVEAGLILKSAADPTAETNDGTRGYALNPEFAQLIQQYGSATWEAALTFFLMNQTTLAEKLRRDRDLNKIPIKIKNGVNIQFSPGPHNELQKQIIELFLPNFGFGAEVLYVGDTADKFLFLDAEKLRSLKFSELAHDQLPDVVAYSKQKNWLYLIEAVYSANPISELRRMSLLNMAKNCEAGLVLVTAFPDRATFRKYAKDVAWETEVWIADAPEHMIHFNGDKFLGPYKN